MATKTPTYPTAAPQLTDATIARIRAAAHRYVLAGGSIFPTETSVGDPDDHIANVDAALGHTSEQTFGDLLDRAVPDFETHEQLHEAAWRLVTNRTNAAFVFGAFVGLEFAALTVGQLATIPPLDTPRPRTKRRQS